MLERLLARWPLKVLALLLAFLIWLSVAAQKQVPRDFRVPIDVSLSDDWILSQISDSTVSVRLRGPENAMEAIDPIALTMRIDLIDAAVGENEVLLTDDRLSGFPRGAVDIVWIDPQRVELLVDRRMRRSLPVEPTLVGEPPEGYALYGSRVVPQSIEVEGPEMKVSTLEVLRTAPIRLDGQTGEFRTRVAAVPDSVDVRVVGASRPEVFVDVDVAPVEAAFDGVPVVVRGAAGTVENEPTSLSVTVAAPPALLARLRPAQHLRAVADASALRPGRWVRVPVAIEVIGLAPRDRRRVRVTDVNPERVSVRLQGARSAN